MKGLIALLICFSIIICNNKSAVAESLENYDSYMSKWDKNIALASEYLRKAEVSMKEGNPVEGCKNQKKASSYGIKATESLIKAFRISGTTDDLSVFESGLNKWKELGDFCN